MARAEAKYFITAVDRTKGAIRSAKRGLGDLKGGAEGFNTAVKVGLAAAGAGLAAFALKLVQAGEKLQNLARVGADIGTFGKETAELAFIADDVGMSIEQLSGGIENLQERIQDAKTGSEDARRTFQMLGVDFTELAKKSPLEQLLTIDEALEGISDRSQRIAAISETFGGGFGRLFEQPATVRQRLTRGRELGVSQDAGVTQAAGSAMMRGMRDLGAVLAAQFERATAGVMQGIGLAGERGANTLRGLPNQGSFFDELARRQLDEMIRMRRILERNRTSYEDG